MDSAFSTYERLTELNEGLATFVELVAAGKATVEIPAVEFRAVEFRNRLYAIGPALAFVLERLRPGWQAALEADDKQYLDRMLESVVGRPGGDASCALPDDEVAIIERTAQRDVAAVITGRRERRLEFDTRPGWRVVVLAAEGQPLWPKGFDPLNVEPVEGGFLHTRFLSLGSDAGDLRAIDEADADIEALTEGVGPHPLFQGVRRVVLTGLVEPKVSEAKGKVGVRAPGLTVEFFGATVTRSGEVITVRVGS
jgi:hypothetical protein